MIALPFFKTSNSVPKPLKINTIGKVETVGEHIRAKRILLGLKQKDVAELMGVCEDSITYWETNRAVPSIKQMPKIIDFLGYTPIKVDTTTIAGELYMFRIINGLTCHEVGKRLNVHPSTVESWERKGTKPNSKREKALLKLLRARIP